MDPNYSLYPSASDYEPQYNPPQYASQYSAPSAPSASIYPDVPPVLPGTTFDRTGNVGFMRYMYWLSDLWNRYLYWILGALVVAVAIYYYMQHKKGSGASIIITSGSGSPPQISSSASTTIDVSQSVSTKPSEKPQIAYYVKDYSQLYNNDLTYVKSNGEILFPWHAIRFERPDLTKTEGNVFTDMGGKRNKKVKWLDNPTKIDLTTRIPGGTGGKTYVIEQTGDLAAQTENFKYVFKKDAEGYIVVVDSVDFTTEPMTEVMFRLAKLSNPSG